MSDYKTTDYCLVCGESPDSASHGPFADSHEYVPPVTVEIKAQNNLVPALPMTDSEFDDHSQGEWFALLYKASLDLINTGPIQRHGDKYEALPPSRRKQGDQLSMFVPRWKALWRVLDLYSQWHAKQAKRTDVTWKSIVRDAFLEGRDDDAIDILLTEAIRISIPARLMRSLVLEYGKDDQGRRVISYRDMTLEEMGRRWYGEQAVNREADVFCVLCQNRHEGPACRSGQ